MKTASDQAPAAELSLEPGADEKYEPHLRLVGPEYGECKCNCGLKTKLAPRSDRSKGWVKGEPLRFVKGHNLPSLAPALAEDETRALQAYKEQHGLCDLVEIAEAAECSHKTVWNYRDELPSAHRYPEQWSRGGPPWLFQSEEAARLRDLIARRPAEREARIRAEQERLKTHGDRLDVDDVAELLGVTRQQVHSNYICRGLLTAGERVIIEGQPVWLFNRADVNRLRHELLLAADPRRMQHFDPEKVLAQYEKRGLTERLEQERGLSKLEATAIVEARTEAKWRQWRPHTAGRKPRTGPPPHHVEWADSFAAKRQELERAHRDAVELDLPSKPPSNLDVALAVAEQDYRDHPGRWGGYLGKDGIDPKLARSAARRVWMAVKPLQNAVSGIIAP